MRGAWVLLTCLLATNGIGATAGDQHRLYDCAANCLYLFCSLTNNKISYDKSLELLPVTDKGNSMLEFTTALQKCGFGTEAKIIRSDDLVRVKSPSIVLHYPNNKANGMGHFFILIPQNDRISVYDYPRQVETFPTDYLIAGLKQKDINEFPIIMCKAKRELGEGKGNKKIAEVEREIIFKGFAEQLVAQLDFGHQVEASLIRCRFHLVNRSSAPIEVTDVRAECKCSKMYVGATYVSPGNSCMITMDISLAKKYKDVAVRGWGTINQADGALSTKVMMLIKGYSEPRVLCKPQKIDFGTIKTNSGLARLEGIRVLKTEYGRSQAIKRIESTASNINISNIRRNIDSFEFDITLDSTDVVGLQTSKINVFLDNESEPASWFDVMALLQLDCAVSPRVAIVKGGLESVVTITPKEQKFAVEKALLAENSDYFNVSYSNGTACSSIRIAIGNREPPQQLIKDVVEVLIRLKDTQEERVLRIPMIYMPHS